METNILKNITEEAKKRGHSVRIRDIAYALLKVSFNDSLVAYTIVFGTPERDEDLKAYDKLESVNYLTRYFQRKKKSEEKDSETENKAIVAALKKKKKGEGDLLSFDENYAGAVEQLKRIEELRKRCPASDIKTLKDLEKAESDLRVRLVDKFNVQETNVQQYIFVQPKFNHICEHTRRECWLQTKEFAMEHWNLIENPEK